MPAVRERRASGSGVLANDCHRDPDLGPIRRTSNAIEAALTEYLAVGEPHFAHRHHGAVLPHPSDCVVPTVRDVIIHSPEVGNAEGLKSFNRMLRTAFPDWHSTLEELIAEGDSVAERWTGRGTHQGVFQGIPPTGKRVEVPGVVYRIRGGAIAEFRGSFDGLRLLQQL